MLWNVKDSSSWFVHTWILKFTCLISWCRKIISKAWSCWTLLLVCAKHTLLLKNVHLSHLYLFLNNENAGHRHFDRAIKAIKMIRLQISDFSHSSIHYSSTALETLDTPSADGVSWTEARSSCLPKYGYGLLSGSQCCNLRNSSSQNSFSEEFVQNLLACELLILSFKPGMEETVGLVSERWNEELI